MAEAKLTLPDGRTAVVRGPTKEAVLSRVEMLRKESSREKAQRVGREVGDPLRNLITGEDRATEQTPTLPEIHRSGILAGEDKAKVAAVTPAIMTATDPGEIAQIVTSNFPNVGVTYNKDAQGNPFPILVNNKTGARTIINRPGASQFDVLQTGAIGAALFPTNRAVTALGAGAKAALGETALQGVQAASGGEFDTGEVALSGGLGGTGQGLENLLSGATRIARGTADNEIVEGALDIPVMTSDIRPPQTFLGQQARQAGESVPLVGTGGVRARQQQAREAAVEDVMSRYSTFSYEAIVSNLKEQTNRVKRAAGNVLGAAGRQLDQAGDVPLSATQKAMKAAQRELTKPGVIQSTGAIADLQVLMEALSKPQTFTSLKENRTAFREILQGVDKADRSQLPSRAKATLESVREAMTEDMEVFARENLPPQEFAKWRRANAAYAEHADTMRRSRLRRLLDVGDVRPEQVETLLFSAKPSDVRLLYENLSPAGRANARAAIIQKVVSNLSRRQNGITPNSFVTEMRKFGGPINTFFKGEERERLMGLQRVLEATTRGQAAAANPATGRQLISYLTGGFAGAEAVATGGVPVLSLGALGSVGGLARMYESPLVRDALLRLGSIRRDSDVFDRALRDAVSAMTSAGQAIVDEQQVKQGQ